MKPITVALLVVFTASAQVAKDANSGYQTKEGRDRVASTLTEG